MAKRYRIALREFASLRREKTIVLAVLIQLFIAAFSSFLLVGLVSMYDPGSVATSVEIGVSGEARADLVDHIERDGQWRLTDYESRQEAMAAFDRGRVNAVFHVTGPPDGPVTVEAIVPDESVRSTVIVVQVRRALRVYERGKRKELASRLTRQPVEVPRVPDSNPTFEFTYTVLLPLLVFLPAFISGSIAADSITDEFDHGTLELLRVTPLSTVEIVDGKIFAMVALTPVQAATWLFLLRLNGTRIADPVPIVALVTAAAVVVVAMGTGLAIILEERRPTQLLYSLGVIVAFAIAAILPQGPPNIAARFALGSPNATSYALLGGYVLVAAAGYLAVRRLSAGLAR